jgi:hypothetical protein
VRRTWSGMRPVRVRMQCAGSRQRLRHTTEELERVRGVHVGGHHRLQGKELLHDGAGGAAQVARDDLPQAFDINPADRHGSRRAAHDVYQQEDEQYEACSSTEL